MIVDCGSNQRALFQVIGNHLLIKPAPKLTTHDSAALLAKTIRIVNDFLLAADKGEASVLALLDMSSAFDTIDHAILLRRLEFHFGLGGTVLKWIESYTTGRLQSTCIFGIVSVPALLKYGIG